MKNKQIDKQSDKQNPLVDVNELCSQLTSVYGSPTIVEKRYASETYQYAVFTENNSTVTLLMKCMMGRDYTVKTSNVTVAKQHDSGLFQSIHLLPVDLHTSCEEIVDRVSGWITTNS